MLKKTIIIMICIVSMLLITSAEDIKPIDKTFREIPIDEFTTQVGKYKYNYISTPQNFKDTDGIYKSCSVANYTHNDTQFTFYYGNRNITFNYVYINDITKESQLLTGVKFIIVRNGCEIEYEQVVDTELKEMEYTFPQKYTRDNYTLKFENGIKIDFKDTVEKQNTTIVFDDKLGKATFTSSSIGKLDPIIILDSTNSLTDDAYGASNNVNSNYDVTYLVAGKSVTFTGASMLKFNTSSFLNTFVDNAMLTLTTSNAISCTASNTYIHDVYAFPKYNISNVEWNETTFTYANYPNTTTQVNLTASNYTTSNATNLAKNYFNVTDVVKSSLTRSEINTSFLLNASSQCAFRSSEDGTTGYRPTLNVTYYKYLSLENPTPADNSYVYNNLSFVINVTTALGYNSTIFYSMDDLDGESNITLCTNCENVTKQITVRTKSGRRSFTVYANDSSGTVVKETRTVYFYNTTLVINSSNNGILEDTMLNTAYDNADYGTRTDLTAGSSYQYIPVFKVNLSLIPTSNIIIDYVNFNITYASAIAGYALDVYHIYTFPIFNITNASSYAYDWDEGESDTTTGCTQDDLCVTSMGALNSTNMNTTYISRTNFTATSGVIILNVTTAVKQTVIDNKKNITFMLNYTTGTDYATISSKEDVLANRPRMEVYYYTDIEPTVYNFLFVNGTNITNTNVGINFTCVDDVRCHSWILSNNMSGAWANLTASTTFNASLNFNISNASSNYICFQGFANDSIGQWGNTSIYCLTQIPIATANTCSYTSGNWAVTCSDLCNITTDINMLTNNITFSGTGTVKITANVTNCTQAMITNNCSVYVYTPNRLQCK